MKHFILSRSFVLSVAVVALSINALAGYATTGSATPATHPVQVVTGLTFKVTYGQRGTAQPGGEGYSGAECPADYPVLISGGFQASGTYNSILGIPAVVTSEPTTTAHTWLAHLLAPKSSGPISLDAVALCAHITTTTITSS